MNATWRFSFWRALPAALALGLTLMLLVAASSAFADDANSGGRDEIMALQRRLTDAGCYVGAIDGVKGPELEAAAKACPDQEPVLRIETGMHTTTIRQSGVDAACSRLATASDDKTVRVWSLPEGRLERTVRLPMGPGAGGRNFAAALSPNGHRLATGGLDASSDKTGKISLSVLELQTGEVRRFGDFDDAINKVVFSPDGRWIAVALGSKDGVAVFDADTGAVVMTDRDYGADAYGLAFGFDGSLYAASYDGSLRRYDANLRLTAKRAAPVHKRPFSVAADPTRRRLAIGYVDSPNVSIVDAVSLAPIAEADTGDLKDFILNNVAWSRDGSTLMAGGDAQELFDGEWRDIIRRFSYDGRRLGADVAAATDAIQDIETCPNGFLFVASEPSFGFIASDGAIRKLQGTRTADLRGKLGGAFTLSADAAKVRFGLGLQDQNVVEFDLLAGVLSDSSADSTGLSPALTVGLPVADWQDNAAPKFKRAPIQLEAYELSRSLAIRPDRSGFVLGGDWHIRSFDASGKPRWIQPAPGVGWGVNLSADGEIVTVALGDGTIRWLRWSDGQELLALFVEAPTRKWVAWTPTGYYMASPGAEDMIGWHVNRGWAQQADFFPDSRFSARFNRPDIVQLMLKTRDEAEAVRQANDSSRRKVDIRPFAAQLPPVASILSPGSDSRFSGDSVEVTFSVRSPSGLPIDGVQALIDGRPVETRGLAPAPVANAVGAGETRRLTIPAPAHDFELALIARSGALVGEATKVKLVYSGAAAHEVAPSLKPKLYIVTIGVSDYVDPDMRLGYADDDARGFGEAMRAQAGGLYSEVKVLPPLIDRAVTRASVISALRWLRKQVTERDIGMVLIAGHGATDDGQNYWFLPSDATRDNLDANGVSQDDLLREMRQVAGKTILFLDTCHSNQAVAGGTGRRGLTDIDGVINEFSKAENGLVVFSSSRGRETSQESAAWGHGAFTKALIEGLGDGRADLQHNGAITLSELDAFVAERVKDLTNGDQHPVMTRPTTMQDFAFAVSK